MAGSGRDVAIDMPEHYMDGRVPLDIMRGLLAAIRENVKAGVRPCPVLSEEQQVQLEEQAKTRGELTEQTE